MQFAIPRKIQNENYNEMRQYCQPKRLPALQKKVWTEKGAFVSGSGTLRVSDAPQHGYHTVMNGSVTTAKMGSECKGGLGAYTNSINLETSNVVAQYKDGLILGVQGYSSLQERSPLSGAALNAPYLYAL